MKRIIIGRNEAEQRVDKFLRKLLWKASLSQLFKLLRVGKIKVNSKKVKPAYDLKLGDEVKIYLSDEDYHEMTSEERKKFRLTKINFKVLYEDKAVLVLDKPAGISMHGASGIKSHTLIDEVLHYLKFKSGLTFRPSFVNRLDKDTSGIVIVGKTFEALRKLNEIMARGEIEKGYMALVKGKIKSGTVSKKVLKAKMKDQIKVKLSEEGKEAITKYKVVKTIKGNSLIEVEILTGRTHQIRAHMAYLKHPVIGDITYGDEKLNREYRKLGLKRQFLHAYLIKFKHPITGKKLNITSKLPEDLMKSIK